VKIPESTRPPLKADEHCENAPKSHRAAAERHGKILSAH
jgi:hypothetical protein